MFKTDLNHARIGLIAMLMLTFATATPAQNSANTSERANLPAPDWQRAAGGTLRFDVASIRLNKTHPDFHSNVPLSEGPSYEPTSGTFTAVGPSLLLYILFAYKVSAIESYAGLVRSLPEWVLADQYDIRAKTDNSNPTKDQMRLMMQSLLEDRFKLKVHREVRESDLFALSLATPGATGPQLRVHRADQACPEKLAAAFVDDPKILRAQPASLLGVWPAQCHEGVVAYMSGHVREGGRDMTMDEIANWLSGGGELEFPMQNRTGLPERYDFIIDFRPEPETEGTQDSSLLSAPTSAEDFRSALRTQLGLRIRKDRGKATFFFVDHAARPSEN